MQAIADRNRIREQQNQMRARVLFLERQNAKSEFHNKFLDNRKQLQQSVQISREQRQKAVFDMKTMLQREEEDTRKRINQMRVQTASAVTQSKSRYVHKNHFLSKQMKDELKKFQEKRTIERERNLKDLQLGYKEIKLQHFRAKSSTANLCSSNQDQASKAQQKKLQQLKEESKLLQTQKDKLAQTETALIQKLAETKKTQLQKIAEMK